MKIVDFVTSRLLLILVEISGKFLEILNFRKIYNPSCEITSFDVLLNVCLCIVLHDRWMHLSHFHHRGSSPASTVYVIIHVSAKSVELRNVR